MHCRTAALLSLVAIISPGCTTYITQVQAQESGEDDAASSFPASSYPDADDSSTGDAVEGESSSTGGDASSTGEPDAGSTTLAIESSTSGSTSGDAPIELSTTGETLLPLGAVCDSGFQCESGLCFGHELNDEIASNIGRCSVECIETSDCDEAGFPFGQCVFGGVKFYCAGHEPVEEGTTGEPMEPPPVGLDLGEFCISDDACQSGVCISDPFVNNDLSRCSIACSPTANDCNSKGHPGICAWGGGDAHWCVGALPVGTSLTDATPPMPAPDYYQDSAFLPLPGSRRVYLIPAGDTAYYIETNAGNGPGYGPIAYDIRSSDGTLLATHAMSDKPVIEPQGVDKYHWVIMRPADGAPKSIFNIFLKNT